MFHAAQVGDSELAQELLLAVWPRLEPLAACLFAEPKDAFAWIAKIVARAVIDRRRYWNHQSLMAWMLKHAPAQPRTTRLPQLTPDPQVIAGEYCLWDTLASRPTWQASEIWALAAIVGLLEIEEAAAGAGCSPVEMKKRYRHGQEEIVGHCLECANCKENALVGSSSSQDDPEAVFRAAQSSLRTVFGKISFHLTPGEINLAHLVDVAVAEERRSRNLRLRLAEASLIVLLAMLAFLAGRYAASNSQAMRFEPAQQAPMTLASLDVFYYTVQANDSLENISARLHIPASEVLALNNLPAGSKLSPGQRLRLPYANLEQRPPQELEFTPFPTATDLPDDAPLDEILQRSSLTTQLWQTLWADVQVIDYGPVGYYGPPQQVSRKQVWISQPDHVRIIYGPLAGLNLQAGPLTGPLLVGEPDGSLAVSGGILFGQDFHNGATYRDLTTELLPDLDLQKLIFPKELPPGVNLFDSGEVGWVSGRRARVMDAYNPIGAVIYRYWIDEQYGLVLWRREFSGADPGIALRDIIVTRLAVDMKLPVEVFNPVIYRGDRFSQGYSGIPVSPFSAAPPIADVGNSGHEPLPTRSPPTGYDPSTGRLSFQWSFSSGGNGVYHPALELFAESYFLGKARFPEAISQAAQGSATVSSAILPSILICKRSPEGRRLAFSLLPASYSVQKSVQLYILDLFDPAATKSVFPEINSLGDFAFSADGSQLVFFACRQTSPSCAVFLTNLESPTAEPRNVMVVSFADYFLWSPDSQLIGFLAAQGSESSRSWSYVVVRLEDGEIVEQSDFNWRRLVPSEQSIAFAWSKGSPVQAGGLDECAAPP